MSIEQEQYQKTPNTEHRTYLTGRQAPNAEDPAPSNQRTPNTEFRRSSTQHLLIGNQAQYPIYSFLHYLIHNQTLSNLIKPACQRIAQARQAGPVKQTPNLSAGQAGIENRFKNSEVLGELQTT